MTAPSAPTLEDIVVHYLSKGWEVLPLPPGQKASPPPGTTGRTGTALTLPEIQTHLRLQAFPEPTELERADPLHPVTGIPAARARGNLGLRLPPTVVGIDTDAYGKRHGGATLLEACQAHGALPPTYRLTARDPRTDPFSGVRFYTVPHGFELGTIGRHVDTIRHGWRYVVTAPSTHPHTGTKYQWYPPADGSRGDPLTPTAPPSVAELPPLPLEWLAAYPLTGTPEDSETDHQGFRARPGSASASELVRIAQSWFQELPPLPPNQPPCEDVHHATKQAIAAAQRKGPTGTGRTDLLSPLLRLTLAAQADCRGVREAIAATGTAYTSLPDAQADNHAWKLWHLIGSTLDRLGEHAPWECEHYTPAERVRLEEIASALPIVTGENPIGGPIGGVLLNPNPPAAAQDPEDPAAKPVPIKGTSKGQIVQDLDLVQLESLTPGEFAQFSHSDVGNGARLAQFFKGRVFHTEDGSWRVWEPLTPQGLLDSVGGVAALDEPGRWAKVSKTSTGDPAPIGRITQSLAQIIATEAIEFNHVRDSDEEETPGQNLWEKYKDWAELAKSNGFRYAALKAWKEAHTVRASTEEWDANNYLLGTPAGIVDLRTGKGMPESPEMKVLSRTRAIPFCLRKDGKRKKAGPTEWEKFVEHACDYDSSLVSYIQQAIGYTLTGLTSLEIMFFVKGGPGTGKSTFLSVLQEVMGEYASTLQSDTFVAGPQGKSSERMDNTIAGLQGKRFTGLNEWPQNVRTREDTLKALTGERRMTGRALYQNAVTFRVVTKLWVGTNHLPRIDDRAMWRRIRVISFENKPPDGTKDDRLKERLLGLLDTGAQEDQNLHEVLPSEAASEVLEWALEGARKVIARLDAGEQGVLSVDDCEAVRAATSAYQQHEDRFGLFVSDELESSEGSSVLVRELFNAYKEWCLDREESPGTRVGFERQLTERGLKITGMSATAELVGFRQRLKVARSTGLTGVPNGAASSQLQLIAADLIADRQ